MEFYDSNLELPMTSRRYVISTKRSAWRDLLLSTKISPPCLPIGRSVNSGRNDANYKVVMGRPKFFLNKNSNELMTSHRYVISTKRSAWRDLLLSTKISPPCLPTRQVRKSSAQYVGDLSLDHWSFSIKNTELKLTNIPRL